ncbi:MAG: DUF1203 domain-containing protein [Pseudomonadota bacterium]
MTDLRFLALPTAEVRALQSGGPDANGQRPERQISDGNGNTCRHCLSEIAKGDAFLVLAHRPFPALQPYAEVGPIFIHAAPCPRYEETAGLPALFQAPERDAMLVRGYAANDRIIYGTGQVVEAEALSDAARMLLARPEVAYLHVRSSTNNCYQCRIERGV